MDLNRTPAAIAHQLAEETRALNHRTLDPTVFEQPGDVSEVVCALRTVLERLPQALNQTSAGLRRLAETDGIRMDDGTDPAVAVAAALVALREATGALWSAQEVLGGAAAPLSHMGGHFSDADDTEGDGGEAEA
ncbi:hypothetical protein ACH4TX_41665 [Streptomyces sp. NPDC021098]|uniref:hypothetical protein n=1 Tax=unclassified Streptomyces TaxID=2593676 RepID=UPI0037929132